MSEIVLQWSRVIFYFCENRAMEMAHSWCGPGVTIASSDKMCLGLGCLEQGDVPATPCCPMPCNICPGGVGSTEPLPQRSVLEEAEGALPPPEGN